jgi:hypothetical protein
MSVLDGREDLRIMAGSKSERKGKVGSGIGTQQSRAPKLPFGHFMIKVLF